MKTYHTTNYFIKILNSTSFISAYKETEEATNEYMGFQSASCKLHCERLKMLVRFDIKKTNADL